MVTDVLGQPISPILKGQAVQEEGSIFVANVQEEWIVSINLTKCSFKLLLLFPTGATAADALACGYRTILIEDCSRGVDLKDIEKTKNIVTSNNGVIVDSSQVGFQPTLL